MRREDKGKVFYFTDQMAKNAYVHQQPVDYTKGHGQRYRIRKYVTRACFNGRTIAAFTD